MDKDKKMMTQANISKGMGRKNSETETSSCSSSSNSSDTSSSNNDSRSSRSSSRSSSSRTSTNTSTNSSSQSSSLSDEKRQETNESKQIIIPQTDDKNNHQTKNVPDSNRFKEYVKKYVTDNRDRKSIILFGSMILIVFTLILLTILVTNKVSESDSSTVDQYTNQILASDDNDDNDSDLDETDTSDSGTFDYDHTTVISTSTVTYEFDNYSTEQLSTTNSYTNEDQTTTEDYTNSATSRITWANKSDLGNSHSTTTTTTTTTSTTPTTVITTNTSPKTSKKLISLTISKWKISSKTSIKKTPSTTTTTTTTITTTTTTTQAMTSNTKTYDPERVYSMNANRTYSLNLADCGFEVLGDVTYRGESLCLGYFVTKKFLLVTAGCVENSADIRNITIKLLKNKKIFANLTIVDYVNISDSAFAMVETNNKHATKSVCIYETYDSDIGFYDYDVNSKNFFVHDQATSCHPAKSKRFNILQTNCSTKFNQILNDRRVFFRYKHSVYVSSIVLNSQDLTRTLINGAYSIETGEFFPINYYVSDIRDYLQQKRFEKLGDLT